MHLFLMDPVEQLNLALDSSLRMAFNLVTRGEKVFHTTVRDLSWENEKTLWCQSLSFDETPQKPRLGEKRLERFEKFKAVYIRKDPPVNLSYQMCTWFCQGSNVKVFNAPSAIQSFNEKMGIMRFSDDIPESIVSMNADALIAFGRRHTKIVLKPLDFFGGEGVLALDLEEMGEEEFSKIIQTSVQKAPYLAQRFLKGIEEGEVRVFTAMGKAISWCLKVPQKGSFLANTARGASLHPYTPSQVEIERAERVAGTLLGEGIYLIGFDMIESYITEINITSPRLLRPAGEDALPFYEKVVDLILGATISTS